MKTIPLKRWILLGCLASLCWHANGQAAPGTKPVHGQLIVPTDYWIDLPEGYEQDTLRKWPMILFLHGSAESNSTGDIPADIVRRIGPPSEIDKGRKLPFIVITPQAREYGWEPRTLVRLMQKVLQKYRIDPDRVYLTGMSLGGFGVWETAKEAPSLFAAIAPVCGGLDTTNLGRLRHVPIWAFHGDRDESISIEWSRKMVAAARKYNPQVDFTVYEGGDHHIYFDVYRRQDLYDWFLLHARHHHPIADPVDPAILKRYTGKYITDQSWPTMDLELNANGKLTVWGGELLPIAHNRFVQSTVAPGYIEFLPNPENGRMELHWRFTQYEGATLFWKE